MKIAICDDEKEEQQNLKQLITSYLKTKQSNCQISYFQSGSDLLKAYQKGDYDIIFLDIYMNGLNGIETAEQIRSIDETVFLVFATSSPDHAIAGYDVSALSYLLKPIQKENLEKVLQRCESYLSSASQTITLLIKKQEIVLLKKDIIYAEVYDKVSTIHTADGSSYSTYLSLNTLLDELGGLPFIRCHQSFIINYQWVSSIKDGKHFKLKTEDLIPIPRSRKQDLIASYNHYLIQSVRSL